MSAIRGAITLDCDTNRDMREAVQLLFDEIISKNNLKFKHFSHIIFSCTPDIKSGNPATELRAAYSDAASVPLFCVREHVTENFLPLCVRVLIVCEKKIPKSKIKHIYLKKAIKLREDLI